MAELFGNPSRLGSSLLKLKLARRIDLRYGNARKNRWTHSRTAPKKDRCPSDVKPRSIFAELGPIPSSICSMQVFTYFLRWLRQTQTRRAHLTRADDLLKKLSRSLSSK